MSYRIEVMTKRDTRMTEIVSIVIFLSLTLVFMMSKKIDGIVKPTIDENFADELNIIDIPRTKQPDKVIKPVAIIIPISEEEENDIDEDEEEIIIEDSIFDFFDKAPDKPGFRGFDEDDPDEEVPIYIVEIKPKMLDLYKKRFISFIANNYPKMARKAGINGRVTLQFLCTKDGIPEQISVYSEKPKGMDFGAVAVEALKHVRFSPGIQGDTPVNVRMKFPVKFIVK